MHQHDEHWRDALERAARPDVLLELIARFAQAERDGEHLQLTRAAPIAVAARLVAVVCYELDEDER